MKIGFITSVPVVLPVSHLVAYNGHKDENIFIEN